jgi:26S proteasome regulatory subunit N12
MFPYS